MDTRPTRRGVDSVRAGDIALILAILAAAATLFIYVLSLSDWVDPPNWVRAVGLMWLPIGFFGTPIAYALARNGPGRHRARIGVMVAVVALLTFVALLFAAG